MLTDYDPNQFQILEKYQITSLFVMSQQTPDLRYSITSFRHGIEARLIFSVKKIIQSDFHVSIVLQYLFSISIALVKSSSATRPPGKSHIIIRKYLFIHTEVF